MVGIVTHLCLRGRSPPRRAPLQKIRKESSEGVDDFAGGVGAGSACEAVAGMRAGAAEKKAADRSFVARSIENGTHGEELIESDVAVEEVAEGEDRRVGKE